MLKKILLYLGIILAFLVLSYAYLPQILEGKVMNQADSSGWLGMANESIEWNTAHPDNLTEWSESMFGGMPNVTFMTPTKGDWTQKLYNILMTGKKPANFLFISLLGAFLMMLSLGVHPLVAFGGAIAVTFCSYNLQIIQVGHNTKMQALAFLPWVLAALFLAYRGIRKEKHWLLPAVLGAAFFGLTVSFQVKANHPQISYYLALIIMVYALVTLIWILIERRDLFKRFVIVSAMMLVMGCCGIATNATKLLPTMEYTPYSMRGGSSAKEDGTKESKGLDLDYATAWSYSWQELPNLIIPNFNGGSSAGAVNPDRSATYELLKKSGMSASKAKSACRQLPLYWGPQPFTAGPNYLGAVTMFLFILGLMYYKDKKEKWWIVVASALAVLLSLGCNLMWFTKLAFKLLPLYNKFRTVSMSLTILQFTLPIMGFLMLDSIVRDGKGAISKKQIITCGAISAGLCLFLTLVQSLFGSFYAPVESVDNPDFLKALAADRRSLLWADSWRSILMIVCTSLLLLWGLSREKKTGIRVISATLVSILLLLDLFIADKRYLNKNDLMTPKEFSHQFDKRPVDEMILQDPDPSYRVLDLSVNVFNDSHPSYWHKNIGGYSPAKLQRYSEFIDSHLMREIQGVSRDLSGVGTIQEACDALQYYPGLASMNCRYIILGAEYPPLVYKYAKGNAWFENGGDNSAVMTEYTPNKMKYVINSETGGKLVFSEVYYPKGWKLTMDGSENLPIDLYEGSEDVPGNILRCTTVPAGIHELVMTFKPASYARGEMISRISSIIILLLVLSAIVMAAAFKYGKS